MVAVAIIEDFSFYATALTKIEIPASVTKIGYGAFRYITKEASVLIHSSKDTIKYDADGYGTTSTTPGPLTFYNWYNPITPTYVTD